MTTFGACDALEHVPENRKDRYDAVLVEAVIPVQNENLGPMLYDLVAIFSISM